MVELDAVLSRAEAAVQNDPTRLRRVQMVRMGLDLAILVHGVDTSERRASAFERFFNTAGQAGWQSSIAIPGHGSHDIASLKQYLAQPLDGVDP